MAGVLVVDRRDSGAADRLVLVGGVQSAPSWPGRGVVHARGLPGRLRRHPVAGFAEFLGSQRGGGGRRHGGRWGSRVADVADQCRWATVVGGGDVRLAACPVVPHCPWLATLVGAGRCLRSDRRTGWRAEAAVLRAGRGGDGSGRQRRAIRLPGDVGCAARPWRGVRDRRTGAWREPFCGWTHRVGAAGSGVLVGVRDRIRGVGQRFRRGRNAGARRALPGGDLHPVSGDRQLSRAVPGRGRGRLGASGHDRPCPVATGPGLARPELSGTWRAYASGAAPPSGSPRTCGIGILACRAWSSSGSAFPASARSRRP